MQAQLLNSRLNLIPTSLVTAGEFVFGLKQDIRGAWLAIVAPQDSLLGADFEGESTEFGDKTLWRCPLSARNAASLRACLPWLSPQLIGLRTSAGMGDRLGMATPGHVRALQATNGIVIPVFAQQSVREMQRTARSPQQVMDDATWGMLEAGWQGVSGADADHLKATQDIDACLAAGFTLFTLDPGEYVSSLEQDADPALLVEKIEQLPPDLQPRATGLLGKTFDFEGSSCHIDRPTLLRAIYKYGAAIQRITVLYAHLAAASSRPFELEISMDETDQPTSPAEHAYIASELRRLGVNFVSFAPRFVGRFEKGVDYIGDLPTFDSQLAIHAAVARQLGPYKLSLHSGSDKFSLYSIFTHHTHGLCHLKTAGTSYLEALRTIAEVDEPLFREIYQFARLRFATDRQSYHISADLERAPEPQSIRDWPALLDQFDARQVLHVTFGSVLTAKSSDGCPLFRDRLMQVLQANRERYFDILSRHFQRHLEPFSEPISV